MLRLRGSFQGLYGRIDYEEFVILVNTQSMCSKRARRPNHHVLACEINDVFNVAAMEDLPVREGERIMQY